MNKLEGFPTINCVSLEESTARRESLSSQFAAYGLTPNYLLSKRYSEGKDIVFGTSVHYCTDKTTACAVSHLKMIKKWYDTTDEKYGFFCEDDLSLETIPYWDFTFHDFMQQLPPDWEALQLCIIRDFLGIANQDQWKPGGTFLDVLRNRDIEDWSATAYILTRNYAKKLIDQYIFQLKDIFHNLPPYWGEATVYKLEVIRWPEVSPLVEHMLFLNTGKVYACPLFVEDINGPTTSSEEQAPNHIYSANFIMDWWKKPKTELIPIDISNTTITYNSLKEKYNMNIKGIIHVGAHYGEEINDYIESGVKKLVLFEPLKDNFNIILDKIKNLDVDITLHQTALGSQVIEETMYVSDNEKLSSSLLKPKNHLLQYSDVHFPDTEKVKINLLDSYQYTEYNYLHIDVQGYELEVLKGSSKTLKYIDYIYCEVNRDELYEGNAYVEQIDEFLLQYNMKRVETDWKGESWGDALYIKKNNYNTSNTCQIQNLNSIYEKYFGYPSNGFFVEVGAYDGETFSNTSCLADHGWKGIYVEPIKQYYHQCLDRHKNNNVSVIQCSIGDEEIETDIYVGGGLTTTNKKLVEMYSEIDWSKDYVFYKDKCHQIKLNTLLLNQKVNSNFDLLVVDVEGSEENVFNEFDLEYWNPQMMIIELIDNHHSFQKYSDHVESNRNLRSKILSFGYIEIYRDEINTIFVKKDLYIKNN